MSFAREDFYNDEWRFRSRNNGYGWMPKIIPIIGSRQNRLYGMDFYQYRTEIDLLLEHDAARELFARNPIIKGVMEDITSFVVGTGYTPKVDALYGQMNNQRMKDIAKMTQRYLEEWAEGKPNISAIVEGSYNREPSWKALESETFTQGRIDGDAFVRYFYDREAGLKVRRVEPEYITTPSGSTPISEKGFGIENFVGANGSDLARIVAYWYRDPITMDELRIPASKMSQYKNNVVSNVKRGISDFFSCYDDAQQIDGLLLSLLTGAKLRAAIAFLEVIQGGAPGAVADIQQKLAARFQTNPIDGTLIPERHIGPGTIVTNNGAIEVKTMPQGTTDESIAAANFALKILARVWGIPENMISGNVGDMNYSTMLAAGTPFVIRTLRVQGAYGNQIVLPTYVHAVCAGVYAGHLPWDSLSCNVSVHGQTPVISEKLEEAQVQQIRLQNKTMSPQQAMVDNGVDPEETMQQWREWEEEFPTMGFTPELANAMGEQTDEPSGGEGGGVRGEGGISSSGRTPSPREASLANTRRATASVSGD